MDQPRKDNPRKGRDFQHRRDEKSRPFRKNFNRRGRQAQKFGRIGRTRYFHPSNTLETDENPSTSSCGPSNPNVLIERFDKPRSEFRNPPGGQRDPLKRNVEVHSEEQDEYFRRAMETVKEGIHGENLDMFISNVLEQTEGQELQLSCQGPSSYCIEFLLNSCDDVSVIIRFMKALEVDKAQCCGNRYASHITETLLYHAIKNLQNWSEDANSTDENEESAKKAQNVSAIMSWLCELSEFCLENLKTFFEDYYACYVLRHLIQVLGGRYINEDTDQSKKSKAWKEGLKQRYLGEEFEQKSKPDIVIDEVPKFFLLVLKKFSKAVRKLDDLKAYVAEARTVPILCTLLDVLKKRLPKKFLRVSRFFINLIFEDKDPNGIPLVLLHQNCSYLVQKLYQTADAENQNLLWNSYICDHLEKLIQHSVGNFVLQRLFDGLESSEQFEIIYPSIARCFAAVVKSRHFGIFVSLTSTCLRLKSQQAQITKDLMQCFQCDGDEDKQEYLVPTLLSFQSCDDYLLKRSSSPDLYINIILQGSLVVQSLLKFHKPFKVVRSLLSMKPEELKYIACHIQGCHVLTCFLSCDNVGEKNKVKFLSLLKPILLPLVCDRNGSLTLCRMWMLLTTKQKSLIAEELSRNESKIRDNQCAYTVYKKFGIHLYQSRNEEWKKFLENPLKRKSSEQL